MYLFQLVFSGAELPGVGTGDVRLPLHVLTGQLHHPQRSLSQAGEVPAVDGQPQGACAELFHRAHLQHKALTVDVRAEAAAPGGGLLRGGAEGREADPDKYPAASSAGPGEPQDVDRQGAAGRGEEQGEVQEGGGL